MKKIQNVKVTRGHVLCSFDLVDMYTNIPVQEAIATLQRHLISKNAPTNEVITCIKIVKTCMEQNYFQFRGKVYKQTTELSMGSKLSPLLANIFMCDLEEKLKSSRLFPSLWYRYVDDIFCVVNARSLKNLEDFLNSQHPSIKFTVEKEVNGKISFLDLCIRQTTERGLEFSIYRKPTHTDRYITSDSHHHDSHKAAAFHSMIYRLLNIPMNESDYNIEKEYIYNAARVNGYDSIFVDKIFRKHQTHTHTRQRTSLTPIRSDKRVVCLPFFPKLTNPLSTVLRRHGMHVVTRNNNTLRDALCNLKDRQIPTETSGIYEISCQDCEEIYIGQSKRVIKDRLKEHVSATTNGHSWKSSVSEHMIEHRHKIDNLRRVKRSRDDYKLDAWESLYITTAQADLMNREPPPIISYLFKMSSLEIR